MPPRHAWHRCGAPMPLAPCRYAMAAQSSRHTPRRPRQFRAAATFPSSQPPRLTLRLQQRQNVACSMKAWCERRCAFHRKPSIGSLPASQQAEQAGALCSLGPALRFPLLSTQSSTCSVQCASPPLLVRIPWQYRCDDLTAETANHALHRSLQAQRLGAPSRTGPLTLRMIRRFWSSKNFTRT